jgi:hypothetical protein
MAKRSAQDTAAAKAKKQKIILVVGGVLLLAVAALQGPKLMKHGGPDAAAPAPAAAPSATGTPVAVTPVAGAVTAAPVKGSAVVAGVALPRGAAVKVETSQLASFTLFEVKDPFVQKVGSEPAADATAPPPAGQGAVSTGASTPSPPGSTGSVPVGTGTAPAAPAPIIYATIDFNSKPQQVQVKGTFPTPEPLFVLRSLTKKQAKISVAGGSFDGGQPVTLKLGKKVTLVNTATGVRYVLKLVYTGSQPEVIEGFTTAANNGAATTTTAP